DAAPAGAGLHLLGVVVLADLECVEVIAANVTDVKLQLPGLVAVAVLDYVSGLMPDSLECRLHLESEVRISDLRGECIAVEPGQRQSPPRLVNGALVARAELEQRGYAAAKLRVLVHHSVVLQADLGDQGAV